MANDRIIEFARIKERNAAKDGCLKALASIPFVIKPGGEVLTKDQHEQRQIKKEEIERAAKERL